MGYKRLWRAVEELRDHLTVHFRSPALIHIVVDATAGAILIAELAIGPLSKDILIFGQRQQVFSQHTKDVRCDPQ